MAEIASSPALVVDHKTMQGLVQLSSICDHDGRRPATQRVHLSRLPANSKILPLLVRRGNLPSVPAAVASRNVTAVRAINACASGTVPVTTALHSATPVLDQCMRRRHIYAVRCKCRCSTISRRKGLAKTYWTPKSIKRIRQTRQIDGYAEGRYPPSPPRCVHGEGGRWPLGPRLADHCLGPQAPSGLGHWSLAICYGPVTTSIPPLLLVSSIHSRRTL